MNPKGSFGDGTDGRSPMELPTGGVFDPAAGGNDHRLNPLRPNGPVADYSGEGSL